MATCEVERKLGQGSFGNVYLLSIGHKPPKLTQKYALKVIDLYGGGHHGEGEEALKELRIMQGLRHPHVVGLVDSFQLHQRLMLVLELCAAGDLRSHLDQLKQRRQRGQGNVSGSSVDESVVISWTGQLSEGLQYLHQKRILHRDLKPQNIFLKDTLNLKIGDLGIARQLQYTKDMAHSHIGTPLYISPEIYQGNAYSYKTDIWSLGCCVFEMMTLNYAFHAPCQFQLMGQIIFKQASPLPKHYSSSLRALVSAMLNKEPDGRPDAAHILQSLQLRKDQDVDPPDSEDPASQEKMKPEKGPALLAWRQNIAVALQEFHGSEKTDKAKQLSEAMAKLNQGGINSLSHAQSENTLTGTRNPLTRRRREALDSSRVSSDQSESEASAGSTGLISSRGRDGDLSTSMSTLELSSYDYQSILEHVQTGERISGSCDAASLDAYSDDFESDDSNTDDNESRRESKLPSPTQPKVRPLPYPAKSKLHRFILESEQSTMESEDLDSSDTVDISTLSSTSGLSSSSDSTTTLTASEPERTKSGQDVDMAYANEVIQWARARFISLELPNDRQSMTGDSQHVKGKAREKAAGQTTDLAEAGVERMTDHVSAAGDADFHETAGNTNWKKKKKNFLKERISKQPKKKTEQNGVTKQQQVPAMMKNVRLFTRAQQVTFNKLQDDDLDLSIGSKDGFS